MYGWISWAPDAYSYVTKNHVQNILLHDYIIKNFAVLKTTVLPSHRQDVESLGHFEQVCILTAKCTSMVGYVI